MNLFSYFFVGGRGRGLKFAPFKTSNSGERMSCCLLSNLQPVMCFRAVVRGTYINSCTVYTDLFFCGLDNGLTFHFIGQILQNMGHLGSRCACIFRNYQYHCTSLTISYLYIYIKQSHANLCYIVPRIQAFHPPLPVRHWGLLICMVFLPHPTSYQKIKCF